MARYEHLKGAAETSEGNPTIWRMLRGDLLEGKLAHIGLLGGVLNRHADKTPVVVQFDEDVVVQVARLGDALVAQRDEQRIRIGKVADFHVPDPLKERSKKALCTVSPSGKRTTPQVPPLRFFNPSPQADPPVCLHLFPLRAAHHTLNPFDADCFSVFTLTDGLEILRTFHRWRSRYTNPRLLSRSLSFRQARPLGMFPDALPSLSFCAYWQPGDSVGAGARPTTRLKTRVMKV
jgi:hypothetical protein